MLARRFMKARRAVRGKRQTFRRNRRSVVLRAERLEDRCLLSTVPLEPLNLDSNADDDHGLGDVLRDRNPRR